MKKYIILSLVFTTVFASCKKEGCMDSTATNYNNKAKKDDGTCIYPETETIYTVPTTYSFLDENSLSTVDYAGQTERLNQLREMVTYMKTAMSSTINSQQLKDMFANTNGNANGAFSFSSTKQLKDKCFELDRPLFEKFMDSLSLNSNDFSQIASNGQAGIITSLDDKSYLLGKNGIEYIQVLQKGLMGAVFMNQALNTYFSDSKINVDNTTNVSGKNYTAMEHSWDEAFGYFGVDPTFPTIVPADFWGKYSNQVDTDINSNVLMMDNFLKGRAAIVHNSISNRDVAILEIKNIWEKIAAQAAINYLGEAANYFGNDPAKMMHVLSEAYGFVLCLKYAPLDTRKLSNAEHEEILAKFGTNFWNLSLLKINEIKADLDAKY